MNEWPQGPGWWQASDGRWYPPELATAAPGGHDQTRPAARSERSRGRSIRNALALFGSATALSLGLGLLVDSLDDDTDTAPSDLRAQRCRTERAELAAAVERAHAELGRYLMVEELIFVGELDDEPSDHTVALTGPPGAATGYTIVESRECARTRD